VTIADEPIVCVRCGEDVFRVFERDPDGPPLLVCEGCGYRVLLRREGDPEGSGEGGRCLNCGSYFEAEAGISSQVCSARCDRALTAEFNR
jgi:DNA-directed RNA polymerase subunit RPC12/RpoP